VSSGRLPLCSQPLIHGVILIAGWHHRPDGNPFPARAWSLVQQLTGLGFGHLAGGDTPNEAFPDHSEHHRPTGARDRLAIAHEGRLEGDDGDVRCDKARFDVLIAIVVSPAQSSWICLKSATIASRPSRRDSNTGLRLDPIDEIRVIKVAP
jgi:hypothetical protein